MIAELAVSWGADLVVNDLPPDMVHQLAQIRFLCGDAERVSGERWASSVPNGIALM